MHVIEAAEEAAWANYVQFSGEASGQLGYRQLTIDTAASRTRAQLWHGIWQACAIEACERRLRSVSHG